MNSSRASDSYKQQVSFKSICGWTNRIKLAAQKPTALWALDKLRGALVAKFIFYRSDEFSDISTREAQLVSPIFAPMPANSSRLQSGCKLTFRAYITVCADLELSLITVPTSASSGSRTRALDDPGGAYARGAEPEAAAAAPPKVIAATQTYVLKRFASSKVPAGKRIAEQHGEQAAWTDYQVRLPQELAEDAPYKLEFSAVPGVIQSESIQQRAYLNGVAIANFSLSPQCFGLKFEEPLGGQATSNPSDASLVAPIDLDFNLGQEPEQLAGHKSATMRLLANFLDTYKTAIFVTVILILILVIFSFQFLLCASGQLAPSSQKGPSKFWVKLCCCCCYKCCFPFGGQRQQVYASKPREPEEKLKELELEEQEAMRNYLRPLQSVFENVELNENPNYLTNGRAPWIAKSISVPLEPYHVDRKRLTLTKPLGKGAFGEVYQGCLLCYYPTEANTNYANEQRRAPKQYDGNAAADLSHLESHSMKVAVKTLTDERMSQTDFIREAINMSLVNHRNIVELIGVCFDEKPLYIIMELLPGGNLKNFLLKNRDRGHYQSQTPLVQLAPLVQGQPKPTSSPLLDPSSPAAQQQQRQQQQQQSGQSESRVRLCMGDLLVFALDIARACDYLQKKQFIHRDLAARNCLLTSSTKANGAAWQTQNVQRPTSGRTFVGSPPSALDVNANHKVDLERVFLDGYMGSSMVAKLADFGMTRDVYSTDYYRMGHKEMPGESIDPPPHARRPTEPTKLTQEAQPPPTVRWMPPECLDGVATSKSDVWSFGVFLWELFSMGQLPYQNLLDNHQVIEFIKARRHAKPKQARPMDEPLLLTINDDSKQVSDQTDQLLDADENEAGEMPPLPPPHENTPHPIYSIMCACWSTNPEDRPQFEEIANRLYWCLQMPDLLNTSLPCFYEQQTPGGRPRSESRSTNAATTDLAQLNWWCPS